jgi:hypothetical protein
LLPLVLPSLPLLLLLLLLPLPLLPLPLRRRINTSAKVSRRQLQPVVESKRCIFQSSAIGEELPLPFSISELEIVPTVHRHWTMPRLLLRKRVMTHHAYGLKRLPTASGFAFLHIYSRLELACSSNQQEAILAVTFFPHPSSFNFEHLFFSVVVFQI